MPMSTRDRIKHQWKSAKNALDTCRYHLLYIKKLATDQSKYIDEKLPAVLYSIEVMDDVLDAFREGI